MREMQIMECINISWRPSDTLYLAGLTPCMNYLDSEEKFKVTKIRLDNFLFTCQVTKLNAKFSAKWNNFQCRCWTAIKIFITRKKVSLRISRRPFQTNFLFCTFLQGDFAKKSATRENNAKKFFPLHNKNKEKTFSSFYDLTAKFFFDFQTLLKSKIFVWTKRKFVWRKTSLTSKDAKKSLKFASIKSTRRKNCNQDANLSN